MIAHDLEEKSPAGLSWKALRGEEEEVTNSKGEFSYGDQGDLTDFTDGSITPGDAVDVIVFCAANVDGATGSVQENFEAVVVLPFPRISTFAANRTEEREEEIVFPDFCEPDAQTIIEIGSRFVGAHNRLRAIGIQQCFGHGRIASDHGGIDSG